MELAPNAKDKWNTLRAAISAATADIQNVNNSRAAYQYFNKARCEAIRGGLLSFTKISTQLNFSGILKRFVVICNFSEQFTWMLAAARVEESSLLILRVGGQMLY